MNHKTDTTEPNPAPPAQDAPPQDADDAAETNDAAASSQTDRLVPVSEAIRYRKRAQQAEQQLAALQSRLDATREQYEQAEQALTTLERKQRIDALLTEADAIDLDAARLLTEVAVQSMDEPDVAEAVADLRRHKPFLFHAEPDTPGGLALAPRDLGEEDPLAQAAELAQHSGDRRDLLRYLRLRRRP
jgi:vacuolar-type H+-ATPase subunit I/STV1